MSKSKGERIKVMVGEGWMLTLERSPGLEPPDPQRVADAIAALSRVLTEHQERGKDK